MNLYEAVNKELKNNKSLTENGAVAYQSSGKAIVDFNFHLNIYRKASALTVLEDWIKVYAEDPILAIKYLFFLGDVREGAGERQTFRICFFWLTHAHPEDAKKLLALVPEYTRWDAVAEMIATPIKEDAIKLVKQQLAKDRKDMAAGKPVSLLAKWMPSENTSSKQTVNMAKQWIQALGMSPKEYRKTLSALRKYLDVVEVKVSANEWSNIDYEAVPSKANLKYKDAFLRRDKQRRLAYLDSLSEGEKKINASVVNPNEIVAGYNYKFFSVKELDSTLENMWKALPDFQTGNTLVVRDGSGSMRGKPEEVATSLAIYTSEHNSGIWKDKFITFSSTPKFVNLSSLSTLHDKLELAYKEAECSNTNLEATFELILKAAVKNNLPQEELPEKIMVISDMQFDEARGCYDYFGVDPKQGNKDSVTLMESIAERFESQGYTMPKLVFWNVADNSSYKSTIPMQQNEAGVILLSGYSAQLMKMAMSGRLDPYEALVEIINKPRYNAVEEALKA